MTVATRDTNGAALEGALGGEGADGSARLRAGAVGKVAGSDVCDASTKRSAHPSHFSSAPRRAAKPDKRSALEARVTATRARVARQDMMEGMVKEGRAVERKVVKRR